MSLYLGENLISGQTTLVGESRNIGQIIPSAIPLTDAGLNLLDGSLINGNGIYSDFVDYIAGIYDPTANYFCTEVEWQTAVTTYGVCGKFVYDSVNNTVRLPKYNSKIYTGGGIAPVVGNGMTLGLSNGTSNYGLGDGTNSDHNYLRATENNYGTNVGTTQNGNGAYTLKTLGVTTDPTKSGLVAQLSDITTSLDGYYYIVIATSTKTDIQVDIDEIATDLNGKADTDLTNTTPSISFATAMNTAGIRTVIETYVNGTSWYRVYSDGWCEQGCNNFTAGSTGAYRTVSLLKPYKDANYSVFAQIRGDGENANIANINCEPYTIATFRYTQGFSGTYYDNACMWQACGYIN
jgi:hypothetical protein